VLGVGLVHGQDGVLEGAGLSHGLQADDAGGGLLRPADDVGDEVGTLFVQGGHQIGAVVHGDVRLMVEDGVDVLVVGDAVLALDGEDRHLQVGDYGRGHVVLGGQRVAGAEHQIGATGGQGAGQVGRLRSDVQAGGEAHAGQRALFLETLPDEPEHGHLLLCPGDAQSALEGQRQVFDSVFLLSHIHS
jgi:hypothetical protein